MERWTIRKLETGDHIRVDRGPYYHHGIYVGDGKVVHYCAEDGDGVTRPEDVEVRLTPMSAFTRDGFCEAEERDQKRAKRSREEVAAYAQSRVGEKGYDVLNNNCEHFANECVHGEAFSSYVDSVRSKMRELLKKAGENGKKQ